MRRTESRRVRRTAAVALLAWLAPMGLGAQDTLLTTGPGVASDEAFTQITGVRVLSTGEILVADRPERRIVRISADLKSAERIGREGNGPGEYASPAGLLALRGDSTLIVDPGSMRLTVLDRDGRAAGSLPMLEGSSLLWPLHASNEFVFWHDPDVGRNVRDGRTYVQRLNRRTGARDTVAALVVPPQLWPENSFNGWAAPRTALFARDTYAVGLDGSVIVVRHDPYRVDRVVDGRVRAGPVRVVPRVPVTDADKREWAARFAARRPSLRTEDGRSAQLPPMQVDLARTTFPTHFPPFLDEAAQVAPNGDVWVQRALPTRAGRTEYDLFAADGSWRATVRLAPSQRVVAFRGTQVVVSTREDDGLHRLSVVPLVPRTGR